jgi:hypothetical protein
MLRPATVPLTVPSSITDPVTVEAQLVAPGLYIHPTIDQHDDRPYDQWRLAHHSGRAIGKFPSEKQARGAGFIAAQLTDWTRGADEIVALTETGEIDLLDLADLIHDHGGVLLRRSDTAPAN